MFLAYDQICFKLTIDEVMNAEYLNCSHEEADTRILLHCKSAATENEAIVIVCEDTDVLILAIAYADEVGVPIYRKRGNHSRTRYVHVNAITRVIGNKIATSLPGLHAFTGCDSVSAFAGKGKISAYKLVKDSSFYQEIFGLLGSHIEVNIYF